MQVSAPENYHLNEDNITFAINSSDKFVTMYNTKMTEEEIKESNTTESDVNVDNTLSSKSILTSIIAIIITILGLNLVYKGRKSY